jgi:hypothetical protein
MNEAVLQTLANVPNDNIDPTLLAALLLKLPQSGDAQIDAMIRTARVMDLAEQISGAQAADPTAQKEVLRTLQRNYIVAQQIQANIERFCSGEMRAAA